MRLKRGASRTVLLARGYAIKVPNTRGWRLFLSGLLGNMQERAFSRTGWKELCPVLWSDPWGFVVVMPECEPLAKNLDDKSYQNFVTRAVGRVPVEHKRSSFGYLNGKLVAVDYGS